MTRAAAIALLLAACAVDVEPPPPEATFAPMAPPCTGVLLESHESMCPDPRHTAIGVSDDLGEATWCACEPPRELDRNGNGEIDCGELTRSDPRAIGCPGDEDGGWQMPDCEDAGCESI
jgi:hypothetical protein